MEVSGRRWRSAILSTKPPFQKGSSATGGWTPSFLLASAKTVGSKDAGRTAGTFAKAYGRFRKTHGLPLPVAQVDLTVQKRLHQYWL